MACHLLSANLVNAGMTSPQAPSAARPHSPSLGFNLAGIALLVMLAAVGVAYLLDEMSDANKVTPPALNDGNAISQTIAGTVLSIPTAWFRYGEQIRDGFTNEIDLRVLVDADSGGVLPVDVTLLPRSRARTSASLLDGVYLHQFSDDTLAGVPGLVGKPLLETEGYAGESVWYDALSPNPFVAKCSDPVVAGGPMQCVRSVYLNSGIAAVYTFDAALLQSWRSFDTEIEQWLTRIGAW